jgi:hypothetical protein
MLHAFGTVVGWRSTIIRRRQGAWQVHRPHAREANSSQHAHPCCGCVFALLRVATLLRWQKIPEFQTAYRDAKRAAFGQSIARLHQMSSAAVSTLGKIMVDANAPASTRVRAADTILNHTTKAIEIEDIAARVAALEEATQTAGQKR